jgi:hypothetical protein
VSPGRRQSDANDVGHAPARPRKERAEVERDVSEAYGVPLKIPADADPTVGPVDCPACGSQDVMWGFDVEQTRSSAQVHPMLVDESDDLADTFICRACSAGWIEPNDPSPITWVRPYWRV